MAQQKFSLYVTVNTIYFSKAKCLILNQGVIAVYFANNTETHICSVKECRVIVILIQMVWAVYSNYSSNRVKWLPSAPSPRSTGL